MLETGKNDQGEIVGVVNVAKLLEDIPNKVRDILGITVEVNLHTEQGNDWLEIVVDPYPTPISYKGEYHYRSGSTKQALKGAALERFLLHKHGRRWDDASTPSLHIRNCSQTALKLFKSSAAKSGRMTEEVLEDSTESFLDNLQFIDGNYLR